jgi:hypothetical protein
LPFNIYENRVYKPFKTAKGNHISDTYQIKKRHCELVKSLFLNLCQPFFLHFQPLSANYFHEKKNLFSRQEIFFFMKKNIYFHENNSVKSDEWVKKDGK